KPQSPVSRAALMPDSPTFSPSETRRSYWLAMRGTSGESVAGAVMVTGRRSSYVRKRQRTGALHNLTEARAVREYASASRSAPVLWRFSTVAHFSRCAVKGAVDDVHLLLAGEADEVHGVAGDSDRQRRIFFRMIH